MRFHAGAKISKFRLQIYRGGVEYISVKNVRTRHFYLSRRIERMKTRQQALMRQLQLFDDSYEVYFVLPSGKYEHDPSRVEVVRITGQEEVSMMVMIN